MLSTVPTARHALTQLTDKALLRDSSYIGGAWLGASTLTAVLDPASNEELTKVVDCDAALLGQAIDSAEQAFGGWCDLLARERGKLLIKWAELIRQNARDLAVILTAEQGKPIAESEAEILYGVGFIEWFAAEGERAYGETIPTHKPSSRLFVSMQPVGVCAAVTPWNFPNAMIARKAAAALAAGCPIIVKPAVETPLSALALAELAHRAGFPVGVFQVVTGDAVLLTEGLLFDERVRAFSFTGSTEVGRLLLGKAARTVKKVSMELGGHAPFIIFDDADLEEAVEGCIAAKFTTSGQDCLAANRIYVQSSLHDAFVERLRARIGDLQVGPGFQPGVDVGPMTKASVVAKCRSHIVDAIEKGARILVGEIPDPKTGNFVAPTLLVDVTPTMLIASEETFGPVAPVLRFDTEDEVRASANASEMGLAAYLYTSDLKRAMRVSDALEYGMVGVNTASFTGGPIPFGGWKQSGLGREGSRHGLQEFMELKYVCFGGLAA
ncbi:NAD-dependent succinate-semialdehyde dehydrogenase [Rhizobium lusitanum]|jgi:succinate-semialdehyde dehydrogenase/glutarate-semialdehyde dehydrogenase/aspartate-semialdehyde dehydrogenase|uniref:NAD-dependent succinate-semialdehyde dehydrogenase n=1 Tax=Rhizobium lusitanum TaxID=293958 RepID=UPI000DDE6103|nr:NAD-dependent succinate-semialdehyde dehydrogenase [Rhizobium lusitanum]NTJ09286.1 NAD-dependent succinate-semialdehyde dehydrogenase [Rhizobium lusitanum]